MNEQPRSRKRPGAEEPSSVGLVTQLTREMTSLFSKELALARSELSHSVRAAKAGVMGVASGGLVLFAGFLFLLLAAVLGLATIMQPWLAALIVGGTVTVIGFTMVQSSKHKLEPSSFKPTRTANALHRDRDAMKGATL